ncbi:hypothetical protein D6D13_09113 [Aureobasidium pullulans]|uniref:HMG box domain-containing protein n=1 Tax=Aureobasidium pullulans TaxID=5580 RepID=A0A4S9C6A5_AURPU|nr:hypothetical protein D6D13_09113 [Aureobasidium pullulans]
MPRAKSVKPEVAPKPEVDLQQITIDKAEFVRTRDARQQLVTSWITLQNALKNATSAYIDHSNAVLGGNVDLDPSQMDLGAFIQSGELVTVGGGPPAAPEKKQRKKAEPRDPNQPKRPLTAYLLWLGENREKIHTELGPEQKRGEISSEGTKRWHQLPEEVKQKYKDAYQASREVYNRELADFKANGAPVAAESPEADDDDAETDEPAAAAAGADSDDSDDDSSDEEEAPPKEPTPPPVKTPKSAMKGGRKKVEKAAPPASSPPLPASSPVKKGAFTAVNGANKRKSKADAETVAEEPKKKRGRKAKEEEVAPPASTPAEPPASAKKDKKEKKKGRKSVGGDA